MKKSIDVLLAVFVVSMFIFGIANADAKRPCFTSQFGDADGFGQGLSLGDPLYLTSLGETWFPAVTPDFTDKWMNSTEVPWSQPGFPYLVNKSGKVRHMKTAELTIVHAGFRNGDLYLVSGEGYFYYLGPLTPSEIGTQSIVTADSFDLADFQDILVGENIQFVIRIPRLSGHFSIDVGAFDYVLIEVQ